ncbi:MAG: DNA translocase FtsK, partial [Fimbriimonadaceae bacterium]|nr:DNA translocase FtsK [Fimbriimonadaceae bacterium]
PTPEPAPARKQSRIVEKELSEPALPELRPAGPYTLPPLSLLTAPAAKPRRNQAEIQKNIEILETTLEQFGVEANVVEVATGPSLTRFEIQLGPGIRVNKITQLADNIAMSLSAHHVRVEAPIPGKAAIGVEVPNPNRTAVTLREMCDSLEFHQNEGLIMALGKDVAGEAEYGDLTKMPHLLIGGATNSGKSIGLAAIIMSLILRHTPKEVRMVMIDPKRVELSLFDGIPHLMYPVVKDTSEAPGVLRAIVREMERRYEQIEERGVRNIDGWNKKVDREERLPYIVVIVDELADLMMQARAEVEAPIIRIGQKARAVGIHMILATQRPSVDVITGLMKANIPSRIAFSVGSQVDSRTILDSGGAERLMGRGDMLFRPVDGGRMTRIQGCYVSEQEIEDVCRHWKMQEKPLYTLNPIQAAIEEKEGEFREQAASDPLWEEVVNWVVERGEASTSMIQRRFSIGFQRASRLLDMMEERGVVGPREGPRPRQVLIDITQIDMILGRSSNLPPVPPGEYVGDD